MTQTELRAPEHRPGLRRVLYRWLGLGFVGLGVLGALLPILPTTPFLLLASYFFVRSSPGLHLWLLRSRIFGPFLRDWDRHRAVRRKVKVVALLMVPTAVGASVYFGRLPWYLVLLLVVLGAIGMTVVARLPVIRETTGEGVESREGLADMELRRT